MAITLQIQNTSLTAEHSIGPAETKGFLKPTRKPSYLKKSSVSLHDFINLGLTESVSVWCLSSMAPTTKHHLLNTLCVEGTQQLKKMFLFIQH